MPTLTITKSYADGDTLFEADLDNIKDDIENFINVTKINDDNIQSAGITGSTKLVDASVSSAKLASAAVTTSKIADDAVTDAKIQSGGLTAAGIATDAVTTAKILDSNVTTAKIADGAVTAAKKSSLGQQISSSCGLFTTTSTSFVDVTNLSVSITTAGRPVAVYLIGESSSTASGIGSTSVAGSGVVSTSTSHAQFNIVRDSTEVCKVSSNASFSGSGNTYAISSSNPPSSLSFVDTPAAATYTYKVQAKVLASGTANVTNCKLIAYEL